MMDIRRYATMAHIVSRARAAALGALLLAVPAARADFDDAGAGSRAQGMGNAFTAIADDAFGMYYNPAGLGFVRTAQAGADVGKLFFGLDDNSQLLSGFTAIAIPLSRMKTTTTIVTTTATVTVTEVPPATELSTATAVETVKIVVSTRSVTTAAYRHLGTVALGWKYFTLADYYQESAYYLGFGKAPSDRFAWGVNLKYLQEKYTMNDYLRASPVFDYGQKDGVSNVSADAGLLFSLAPRLYLGLAASDINQPDLGLSSEDKLPWTGRVGIGWKEKGLAWGLDGTYRRDLWYYSTGFERFVTDVLGVRLGLTYGGRSSLTVAGGLSFNFYRLQLDYVFQYPVNGLKDIAGTHRMSFLLRFGKKRVEEMNPGSLEYSYTRMKEEFESTKQQLEQTRKEKENLEQMLIEEAAVRMRKRIATAAADAHAPAAATPALTEKQGEPKTQQLEVTVSTAPKAAEPVPVKNAVPETPPPAVPAAAPATAVPAKREPPAAPEAQSVPEAETKSSPATKASKEKAGPKTYIVQPGDNLRTIANTFYKDSDRWRDIYKANKSKISGAQVRPGQELTIP